MIFEQNTKNKWNTKKKSGVHLLEAWWTFGTKHMSAWKVPGLRGIQILKYQMMVFLKLHKIKYIIINLSNTINLDYIFWPLIKINGRKVATAKDKNNMSLNLPFSGEVALCKHWGVLHKNKSPVEPVFLTNPNFSSFLTI